LKKNAAEQGDTNVQDELKKTAEQGCCVMLNQKIDELSQKVDQLSQNVDQLSQNVDQLLENFSVFSKKIQDEFKVIHDVLSTTTE
jgi:phage-related protein